MLIKCLWNFPWSPCFYKKSWRGGIRIMSARRSQTIFVFTCFWCTPPPLNCSKKIKSPNAGLIYLSGTEGPVLGAHNDFNGL